MSIKTYENFDPVEDNSDGITEFCVETKTWVKIPKRERPGCSTNSELLTQLEEQLARVKADKERLESELSSALATVEADKERLDAIEGELGSAMTTIEVKDERIKALEQENAKLKEITPESIVREQGVEIKNLADETVFYALTNNGTPVTNLNDESIGNVVH